MWREQIDQPAMVRPWLSGRKKSNAARVRSASIISLEMPTVVSSCGARFLTTLRNCATQSSAPSM